MTVASSKLSFKEKALRLTLSKPIQATLFVSLCSVTLWSIYFSNYPAIHDKFHSLRHHTALIGCH